MIQELKSYMSCKRMDCGGRNFVSEGGAWKVVFVISQGVLTKSPMKIRRGK